MTIILSIFALLLTSASAYAQGALVERIRFTEYGIYTVDRDVQGRDVLGINRAARVERAACGNAADHSRSDRHNLRLSL